VHVPRPSFENGERRKGLTALRVPLQPEIPTTVRSVKVPRENGRISVGPEGRVVSQSLYRSEWVGSTPQRREPVQLQWKWNVRGRLCSLQRARVQFGSLAGPLVAGSRNRVEGHVVKGR
jgi:hypothetical protein